ncbi:hypothetical protein P3X46_012149 [Hevea brasiliensis]|uniref:DUF7815 domain-containing protein n=1 Tax=Hevea brasiliensis TaxID=3981 RepID=A0ABQ9M9B9_HEVBR|nr:uncharacterized protein LOC110631570 [Hevea brasiliensis]KAJ9176881.1 hypothetical protein P3X46_012149 [Hevea brasiliensis]
MAFEMPYDQIKELQISLRKEAGLASYNPEDPQLPDLPSFQGAISELDPSPPYLRCKQCKGRLLRGINSVICVFCGIQQNKDVAPDPIKFTSTFGCRWFLQSLDLDGSELVAPSVESNASSRGQNTPEIEFPLLDLLDLEIRWPSEPEKFESSVSEKAPAQWLGTLSLAGVDLDNFFTEAKVDAVSASTEEQFTLKNHEDATGSNAFGGHGNLSLFENVKPSEEVPASSKEDESGDSFSGWEADFQSASSGTQQQELKLSDPFMGSAGTGIQHQESKLSDPFVGSSSVDLSSQMDDVFGPGKELVDDKTKENITSASNMKDWFEGDLWSKSSTEVAVQEDQFEVPENAKDNRTARSTDNSSSMNVDWIKDNQWQTTTSSNIAADNRTVNEDDDSFDAWNDFTSSTSVQVPSINLLKQDVNCTMPSVEQESESLFSGTSNSKDVDFGSFSQQDCFPETFINHNGSAEADTMVSESSVSDSMTVMNGRDGESLEEVENFSNENSKLKADGAEMLMSQMHDLSFMLASNLSLPQKKDPHKIDPFSYFSDKD